MSVASLTLSPIQQCWLQEMQVAAPFIAPYRAISKPLAPNTTPTNKSPSLVPARQALKDSLALLKPVVADVAAPSVKIRPAVDEQNIDIAKMDLKQLQVFANQCQACELHEFRTQAVAGSGQIDQPDWFVISTAPSSNEEIEGLPMQGKSGELFQAQMHSIGVNISQQMYLTQLLKCRSETTAKEEHLQACHAILLRQIELIQPKRLLLLGAKAAALFLGKSLAFEALRGHIHQWSGKDDKQLPVIVSYHPSSILLRPQLKAQSWHDLLLMRSLLTLT